MTRRFYQRLANFGTSVQWLIPVKWSEASHQGSSSGKKENGASVTFRIKQYAILITIKVE